MVGYCKCGGIIENPDTGLCASCAKALRKAKLAAGKPKKVTKLKKSRKRIRPASSKLSYYRGLYSEIRKWFLEQNPNCAVFPDLQATEVHHSKGRSHTAYADQWAIDNDMPLLIDARWFIPVSAEGHQKIEKNPDWARERGFTDTRMNTLKK